MTDTLVQVEADIVLPISQFTPVGWQPSNGLSFDEWYEVGRGLSRVGGAVNWWIGDWINYGEHKWGEKYAQALDVFGEQYEYVQLRKMAWVSNVIHLYLRNYKLSWSHHLEVAKLDEDAQVALLDLAERHNLSVRDLRVAVSEYKRNLFLEEKGVNIETVDIGLLPAGMYRIIYADPPWTYDNIVLERDISPLSYYPTMTTEQIAALPVGRLATQDAVLFLWSTSPHLPVALEVAAAWGFEYKTSFVWDKVKHNKGYYNRVRHELLLVCTRGNCTPDIFDLMDSIVTVERTKHSVKPEDFRQMIDALYVTGRRVELFARHSVPGWDAWGNEHGE